MLSLSSFSLLNVVLLIFGMAFAYFSLSHKVDKGQEHNERSPQWMRMQWPRKRNATVKIHCLSFSSASTTTTTHTTEFHTCLVRSWISNLVSLPHITSRMYVDVSCVQLYGVGSVWFVCSTVFLVYGFVWRLLAAHLLPQLKCVFYADRARRRGGAVENPK